MEGSCFYNLEINIKPDPVLAIFPPVVQITIKKEDQTIKGPEITCTNNDPTHKLVFEIYDTQPVQASPGTGGPQQEVSATPIIELDEAGNIKLPGYSGDCTNAIGNSPFTGTSTTKSFNEIDDEGNFVYDAMSYDQNGDLLPNATPKQVSISCIERWIKVISISTPNFARKEDIFKVEILNEIPISNYRRTPTLTINGGNNTLNLTRTVVTGTEVFPRPVIERNNTDEGVEVIIISSDPSTINITPKGTLIVYKVGTASLTIKLPKSKHFEEVSQTLSVSIVQQTIYE